MPRASTSRPCSRHTSGAAQLLSLVWFPISEQPAIRLLGRILRIPRRCRLPVSDGLILLRCETSCAEQGVCEARHACPAHSTLVLTSVQLGAEPAGGATTGGLAVGRAPVPDVRGAAEGASSNSSARSLTQRRAGGVWRPHGAPGPGSRRASAVAARRTARHSCPARSFFLWRHPAASSAL